MTCSEELFRENFSVLIKYCYCTLVQDIGITSKNETKLEIEKIGPSTILALVFEKYKSTISMEWMVELYKMKRKEIDYFIKQWNRICENNFEKALEQFKKHEPFKIHVID